jgi:hypothetical protein
VTSTRWRPRGTCRLPWTLELCFLMFDSNYEVGSYDLPFLYCSELCTMLVGRNNVYAVFNATVPS